MYMYISSDFTGVLGPRENKYPDLLGYLLKNRRKNPEMGKKQ